MLRFNHNGPYETPSDGDSALLRFRSRGNLVAAVYLGGVHADRNRLQGRGFSGGLEVGEVTGIPILPRPALLDVTLS